MILSEHVKKAIYHCTEGGGCIGCPYEYYPQCAYIEELLLYVKELTLEKESIKADTVRKMQSEIKERCIKGGIYPAFVARTIDRVAEEMLEGKE